MTPQAPRAPRSWFLAACVLLASCGRAPQQPPVMPAAQDADGQPARLLSAFFGLDDGLPFTANRLCLGAARRDGIPVVLSHTIDEQTLQKEDFQLITRSGATHRPFCVTLAPALDTGELRTVLLVGDFGDAVEDPAATVRIVADLLSDGATGGPVNFRGTSVGVIPLAAGPSLVLAEIVTASQLASSGRKAGSTCPSGVHQIVRATWTGGVRRPDGAEVGEAERLLYRVTVERPDGSRDDIIPDALADLGDHDNNHLLCLSGTDVAVGVFFPAGHVVDPNKDLNPATRVGVRVGGGAK